MSTQTSSGRPTTANIRAALGRGPMQPGKIEKAKDPRNALTRLTMCLCPYNWTLARDSLFVVI